MAITIPDDYVYLDYAATSPLCEEAARAMAPFFLSGRAGVSAQGNANSLHRPGRAAFAELEQARRSLAESLGAARPDEVTFTSGATEADNAALLGIARAVANKRRMQGAKEKPHVVVSAIEHDAVLAPAKQLAAEGFEVTRVRPDRQGFIEARALEAVLRPETVLVSVQAANSEVGSIQPVAELAALTRETGAFFHADATQALGKAFVDVAEWGVDAASFSAHKAGGPKGVGALYLKARTPFAPVALGGGQELGRRSGTQNVVGAVGFAAAARAAQSGWEDEAARLRGLRDRLYAQACALDGVEATVEVEAGSQDFLPNIVHLLVHGLESETLVLRLDALGFGVSGGSACSSQSLEPSHVLTALGVSDDDAHEALRVSMGRFTTERDIDGFIDALRKTLDWA